MTVEWNDAHSAELAVEKPKEKHKFTYGKGCAELNVDRFSDPEKVASDNWVGGFYMEVYADGWDVDKTVCNTPARYACLKTEERISLADHNGLPRLGD